MAHTHTEFFFATKVALSWRTAVYLYHFVSPPPPNQKMFAPKFLARVFSVTKPKPSAPGFPAGRGFRACHDDMCGFECALLARRVKASPRLSELRGAAWEEVNEWRQWPDMGWVIYRCLEILLAGKSPFLTGKYVFKRLVFATVRLGFRRVIAIETSYDTLAAPLLMSTQGTYIRIYQLKSM